MTFSQNIKDTFLNLFKINDIKFILNSRNQQLKQQEIIEKNIEDLSDTCPKTLIRHFIFCSKNNRYRTSKTTTDSVYNIISNCKSNLEAQDKENKQVITIFDKNISKRMKCKEIEKLCQNS